MLLLFIGALIVRARSFDAGPLPPSLVQSADLPIELPDGRHAKLHDLIHFGRPTVISLWASWCGPCRREAPAVADLARRGGDRINLIYLNVRDESANRGDLTRYISAIGLPKKDYARLDDSRIADLTGAKDVLIPRTLVFNRTGAPIATVTGLKPFAFRRVAGLVGI